MSRNIQWTSWRPGPRELLVGGLNALKKTRINASVSRIGRLGKAEVEGVHVIVGSEDVAGVLAIAGEPKLQFMSLEVFQEREIGQLQPFRHARLAIVNRRHRAAFECGDGFVQFGDDQGVAGGVATGGTAQRLPSQ